jgi:hypothetical protein
MAHVSSDGIGDCTKEEKSEVSVMKRLKCLEIDNLVNRITHVRPNRVNAVLPEDVLRGVMFISCAIKTLRDEAPRNAASTPPVEAVLAAGYGNDVGEFNGRC